MTVEEIGGIAGCVEEEELLIPVRGPEAGPPASGRFLLGTLALDCRMTLDTYGVKR